jgi:signal recognition particle GTPase
MEIEQSLSILIRDGYRDRNPLTPNGVRILSEGAAQLRQVNSQTIRQEVTYRTSANGLSIFGVSGIGKSTAVSTDLNHGIPYWVIIYYLQFFTDLNCQ